MFENNAKRPSGNLYITNLINKRSLVLARNHPVVTQPNPTQLNPTQVFQIALPKPFAKTISCEPNVS